MARKEKQTKRGKAFDPWAEMFRQNAMFRPMQ